MLNTIKERRGKIFGYLLRRVSFKTNIFEGRLNGRNGKGGLSKAFIKEMIRQHKYSRYVCMIRLALTEKSGEPSFHWQDKTFNREEDDFYLFIVNVYIFSHFKTVHDLLKI